MAAVGHKYLDVDVIAFLEEKMKGNTKHYQSDFDIDKDIISHALNSQYKSDKNLLWMLRQSGTHCHKEYEVFIKDTSAHHTWCYYANQPDNPIVACAVELTGQKDGVIRGNVYELDYPALVADISSKSVESLDVEKTFADGFTETVPLERSYYGYWHSLVDQHGPIVNSLTFPKDKLEHANVLREQKTARDKLPAASFGSPQKKIPLSEQIASASCRTNFYGEICKPSELQL